MTTLKRFSEKEKVYHYYQARQEYLRRERAIQQGIEESRAQLERAQREKVEAVQEAEWQKQEAERQKQEAEQQKQEAEQREQEAIQREREKDTEIERLRALLAQQGKPR